MRREEEYRRRLQLVTSEVKIRLDYHVCYTMIRPLVGHSKTLSPSLSLILIKGRG